MNLVNLRNAPVQIAAAVFTILFATLAAPRPAWASDEALKNATVLGALASYGFAWLNRSDIDCSQNLRLGLHSGSDNELSSAGLSASFSDCDAKSSFSQGAGLQFRLMPAVNLTSWKASSGLNRSGVYEATLTPRAQFLVPVSGVKLDATLGIGVSYLSKTSIGSRVKSTTFQFSDELGIGISDASETVRLAFQYRHISNLGIKTPNNPVDFRGLTLTLQFQ